MVVLSGNAPDSYANLAINCVISTAAFFKLQDHFKLVAGEGFEPPTFWL